MILLLNFLSFSIWIYLLFFHGRKLFSKEPFFWANKFVFEKCFKFGKKPDSKEISVVIPARNEENSIQVALDGILKQKKFISYVVISNDQSTDNTITNAVRKFQQYNFSQYKIINIKQLPPGWSGKTWALKKGTDEAIKKVSTNYILYLDADIYLQPNLISKLLTTMKSKKLSMISLMANLNCKTKLESFFIPAFVFFFQKLYPFNLVNNSQNNLAAAAGGCMFCKASVFRKTNIFEHIKSKIIDDCNLAKELKRNGSIWLGLSKLVTSKREYKDLNSIWNMVSRCAFEQLNHSIFLLFMSIIGLVIIYIFPISSLLISLIGNDTKNLLFSLIIFLLTILCYMPTLNFYKKSSLYSFTLPLASFFYILMTISSAFNFHFRKGNEWKGRRYLR